MIESVAVRRAIIYNEMYGCDVFFKIDSRMIILNKVQTTRFVYTKTRYAIDKCDEYFLFNISINAHMKTYVNDLRVKRVVLEICFVLKFRGPTVPVERGRFFIVKPTGFVEVFLFSSRPYHTQGLYTQTIGVVRKSHCA